MGSDKRFPEHEQSLNRNRLRPGTRLYSLNIIDWSDEGGFLLQYWSQKLHFNASIDF